ncbi:MAG: TIGR00725 family protein [Spirochaetales bacterium]|nr:TIGR00725 family protein [Spirochaetales bacterium]
MKKKDTMYIGIIGGSRCSQETAKLAFETGALIAQQGWILVCGGMGGVMEAACEGAVSCNGVTIGILPGGSREKANKYLTYSITTGLGEVRNSIVVKSSDAIIAFEGSYGTLSEIAFANISGKPVISLNSWKIYTEHSKGNILFVGEAQSPAHAIKMVKEELLLRF